jgi:hypothetical protein
MRVVEVVQKIEDTKREVSASKSALEEQTYILTLSAEERARLKLDMPPSLRQKIGGGR